MTSIRRIGVSVLLLSAIASPASAFHDNTLPERYSAPFGAHGWVTLSLDVPEGLGWDDPLLDIEIEGSGTDVRTVGWGEWALDAAGEVTWASAGTGSSGGETYVKLPEPVGVVVDTRQSFGEGAFGMASAYYGLEPGRYRLVVGFVTDAADATSTLTISSADSVGVTVLDSGSNGFMFTDRDFDPAVHATTSFVGAALAGEATTTTSGRLFGIFYASGDVAVIRHEGPNGTTVGFDFMDGEPAGTHRFLVDAEAGVIFEGFYAWGLDVTTLS